MMARKRMEMEVLNVCSLKITLEFLVHTSKQVILTLILALIQHKFNINSIKGFHKIDR